MANITNKFSIKLPILHVYYGVMYVQINVGQKYFLILVAFSDLSEKMSDLFLFLLYTPFNTFVP